MIVMKKLSKIVITFLIITAAFGIIKYINYYSVSKDAYLLESSSIGKYIELYYLTKDQAPENLEDLYNFIKARNQSLYDTVKKIDIEYLKKNQHFEIYLKGYDGKNDSLKDSYNSYEIGLLKSISVKGDLKLNLDYKNKFNIKPNNTLFKVGNDALIEIERFSFLDMYQDYFNCKEIKEKSLDYNETHGLKVRISNGKIKYGPHDFSDETFKTIDKILKQRVMDLDSKEVYIMTLNGYNIDIFECRNNVQ